MPKFKVLTLICFLSLAACGRSDNPAPGPSPDAAPVPSPLAPTSPTLPTSTGGPMTNETVQVAPFRVRCLTRNESSCLSITDANGAPLFEVQDISGFGFSWGHHYTLATTKDESGNYALASVISDQPPTANESFQQPLTRGSVTFDTSNSCNFHLVAGAGFTTASPQVCHQLQTLLNQLPTAGRSDVGTFTYTGNDKQQVMLQSLRTENVDDWSMLRVADALNGKVVSTEDCLESVFELHRDGSFAVRSCGAGTLLQQGYLSTDDLNAVNNAFAQTTTASLGQRTCLNAGSQTTTSHAVFLTTAAGGSYNLQNTNRSEVCFRGDQQSAEQLDQTLKDMKARYDIYRGAASPARPRGARL